MTHILRGLQFTVYEIIGYIAPGAIALVALSVLIWAAFLPSVPISVRQYSLSKEEIAGLLFTMYSLGHFVQGFCNLHPNPETRAQKSGKLLNHLALAKKAMSSRFGVELSQFNLTQITSMAKVSLLQTGKTADFDVLLYREGFYRGSSGAYSLLGAALVVRNFRGQSSAVFDGTTYLLPTSLIISAAVVSFLFAVVFYRRYCRFGAYRIDYLLHFACLPEKTKDEKVAKQCKEEPTEHEEEAESDNEESDSVTTES